jgi:selenocysteine lyase/cysteine desulfurase
MTEATIYLDNAATTWPKPEAVYRAVDTVMREHGANPGRGSYRMSVDAQRLVDEARLDVCRLFNAPKPEQVIFTLNCTDSLCIALKGLIILPSPCSTTGEPRCSRQANLEIISAGRRSIELLQAMKGIHLLSGN